MPCYSILVWGLWNCLIFHNTLILRKIKFNFTFTVILKPQTIFWPNLDILLMMKRQSVQLKFPLSCVILCHCTRILPKAKQVILAQVLIWRLHFPGKIYSDFSQITDRKFLKMIAFLFVVYFVLFCITSDIKYLSLEVSSFKTTKFPVTIFFSYS